MNQQQADERMTKIENIVLRLTNMQVEASERLNALINFAERYLGGRNGKEL